MCCPEECGQCGGPGCDSAGLPEYDYTGCCVNGIVANQDDCIDTGTAPCINSKSLHSLPEVLALLSKHVLLEQLSNTSSYSCTKVSSEQIIVLVVAWKPTARLVQTQSPPPPRPPFEQASPNARDTSRGSVTATAMKFSVRPVHMTKPRGFFPSTFHRGGRCGAITEQRTHLDKARTFVVGTRGVLNTRKNVRSAAWATGVLYRSGIGKTVIF